VSFNLKLLKSEGIFVICSKHISVNKTLLIFSLADITNLKVLLCCKREDFNCPVQFSFIMQTVILSPESFFYCMTFLKRILVWSRKSKIEAKESRGGISWKALGK